MKKGVIEVQFNWIFILVIGALILTFFFTIITKQQDVSKTKIDIGATRDLRTIFTGAMATPGKTTRVNLQNTEIAFDCEGYSVGATGAVRQGLMFAPEAITGTTITTTSLKFGQPFTAANLLLVTSPNIRYILVNSTGELAFIANQSLPTNTITDGNTERALFTKEVVNLDKLTNLNDLNSQRIRFVFFDTDGTTEDELMLLTLNNFGKYKDSQITALLVKPTECTDSLDCYGELHYYKKQDSNFVHNPTDTTYYFGESSVLAAIVTDNIELYNCNMQESFKRYNIVSTIILERTENLENHYSTESHHLCVTPMAQATDSNVLPKLVTDTATLANDFAASAGTVLDNIYQATLDIQESNTNARRNSCALIY